MEAKRNKPDIFDLKEALYVAHLALWHNTPLVLIQLKMDNCNVLSCCANQHHNYLAIKTI